MSRGAEFNFMKRLLTELQANPNSWPFTTPVDRELVKDYYDVIKEPMGTS